MKRAPSALVAIGGFGVAVATLSVATTAAIVLLAPQPPAFRVSPATAIAALRDEASSLDRRFAPAPPTGARAALVERIVSAELQLPPERIRAVWLDRAPPSATGFQLRQPVVIRPVASGSRLPPFVLVERGNGKIEPMAAEGRAEAIRQAAFELEAGLSEVLRNSVSNVPLPAFALGVQQNDQRWLTVQPVRPLLGRWQLNILLALATTLLLLAPLAWFFARRLTRPFRALSGALGETADVVPEEGPRELREAAAAITAMRTRLAMEAAERARMLTAIAHDLRTPLTGLRLRIEGAPEPQRQRMVADVERMGAMIDEVLGFARDAAAPAELLEVRALAADVLKDFDSGRAPVHLAPGASAWVFVPALAFRRALENLVRNAVDYAGGGTVAVIAGHGDVTVSVIDRGSGIAPADRDRLIRPFERGECSRSRATGGAGLGLSIVSDFAAQHRGAFTLASAPTGGTIAALRLPAASRPGAAAGSDADQAGPGRTPERFHAPG